MINPFVDEYFLSFKHETVDTTLPVNLNQQENYQEILALFTVRLGENMTIHSRNVYSLLQFLGDIGGF